MANLPEDMLGQGLIAASAGNHAQGVALGTSRLGTQAIIVANIYRAAWEQGKLEWLVKPEELLQATID